MNPAGKEILALSALMLSAIGPCEAQLWKGAPGDIAALEKAAQRGDAAAMAEFAWHLIEGVGGRQFVPKEIHGLFEKSATKGDPLGKAGLSRCLAKGIGTDADMPRAWKLAEEAAREDHPEGWKQMGYLLGSGYGVPQDKERSIEMTRKAVDAGSIAARSNLLVATNYKGYPDRYSPQAEIALRYGLMNAVINAVYGYYFDRVDPGEYAKNEKLISLLEERAALNHPDALRSLAEVREWQGDADAASMLKLRAARSKTGEAVGKICEELSFAENPSIRPKRTSSLFYVTDSDRKELQYFSYLRGHRSDSAVVAASMALANGIDGRKPDAAAAVELLAENLPGKNKQNHHYLAIRYLSMARKDGPPEAGKLALAHAIYSSDKYPRSIGLVSHLLSGVVPGIPADLAKAKAAILKAPDNDPAKSGTSKLLEGKLSDEQMKTAESLTAEGFPSAGQFVEEARKVLLEAGQLREPQG